MRCATVDRGENGFVVQEQVAPDNKPDNKPGRIWVAMDVPALADLVAKLFADPAPADAPEFAEVPGTGERAILHRRVPRMDGA